MTRFISLCGLLCLTVIIGCHSRQPAPPVAPPVVVTPVPVPAPAPTPKPVPTEPTIFTWVRNNEPDMSDYLPYFCWTKDCTPEVPRVETVPQTPVGVRPTFTIDLTGSVGAMAVKARDKKGNKSPMSNVVTFDHRQ